ncbi:MAG: hypothetical protein LBJ17_03065 [Dysgonamonadaceae bacterium]|nr:hypothetical protein [Dysgonamonadaceae bacterium]
MHTSGMMYDDLAVPFDWETHQIEMKFRDMPNREWRAATRKGLSFDTADYKRDLGAQILSYGVLSNPSVRLYLLSRGEKFFAPAFVDYRVQRRSKLIPLNT